MKAKAKRKEPLVIPALSAAPAGPWSVDKDTMVLTMGNHIQKYCIRDANKKFVAVMLTKETAEAIVAAFNSAAPLLSAFNAAERICADALPKFDWGKSALDAQAIGALNEGMLTIERTRASLNAL